MVPGRQGELELQSARLLGRRLAQQSTVHGGLVGLEVDVGPEDAGELFLDAEALFAEEVVVAEVLAERVVGVVVVVVAVGVAEVAVEVVAAQVAVQVVGVHVALVAELAQGVALVALVVDVALPAVDGEVAARVAAAFVGEDLEVGQSSIKIQFCE